MEGKHDMFTKVCDRKDIVDFVKEVEKHPCLYNKTLPEYANKVHNRRAWAIIAKKANTSSNFFHFYSILDFSTVRNVLKIKIGHSVVL